MKKVLSNLIVFSALTLCFLGVLDSSLDGYERSMLGFLIFVLGLVMVSVVNENE